MPLMLVSLVMPSRARTIVRVMCVLAVLACSTQAARAQGTTGTVPDPITSRELEGYADRLGLSDQQFQAVLMAHDDYREEFRKLRENEIEKLLKEAQALRPGGMAMMMDRKAVEKGLKDLDSVMSRIQSLDNRLFDQMQSVLTEDQASKLPRVRQARERIRYQSGLARMVAFVSPSAHLDLSSMLLDFDLTQQEHDALEPLLVAYESTLTSSARRLYEGTNAMVLELLDKMAAMGFGDPNAQNPGDRGQMWENFRSVFGEIALKVQDKAAAIGTLNRRSLRDFNNVLSDDHGLRLRNLYFQRAYPEVNSSYMNTIQAFAAALKLDDLTAEQRQTITALAADFRTNVDRASDQLADAIDENRKSMTFFDFGSDRRRQFEEKLDGLRERRNALNTQAMDALKATLGDQLSQALDRRIAQAKDTDSGETQVTFTVSGLGPGGAMSGARVSVATASSVDQANAAMVDPFLPGPISSRSVTQYATVLNLTNDKRAVLDTLHEEYTEKYHALDESTLQPVRKLSLNLWTSNGMGGPLEPPTAQAIDQLYDLRRKALTAINDLDSSFFDDLQTTLLSSDDAATVQRLHQSRLREVYNRGESATMLGPGGMRVGMERTARRGPGGGAGGGPGNRGNRGPRGLAFFGGRSNESSVDLSTVVDSVQLESDDHTKAAQALLEYEHNLTEAFRKSYEASMKMQQAMDTMIAQNARANGANNAQGQGGRGPGGGGNAGGGGGFRDIMEGDGRSARQAQAAVVALNRAALTRLQQDLSPAAADAVRRSYNRKAYPDVYQDQRSAEPHITAALALNDLSDQQRTQITQMAGEYRISYDQLCDEMIKSNSRMPDMSGPPQQIDWQAMQDQQRTLEKLNFDRNDLSDKTMARLRALLNEDQVRRLGGLRLDQDE
jgi:hypothetical protein